MKIKIIVFVIFTILSIVLSSQSLRKRETETETENETETGYLNGLKPGQYNGGGGVARPITPNTEVPNLTKAEHKTAGINVIKRKERLNQGGGIGLRTNDTRKNKYRNLNRMERKSRKADVGANSGGGIMKDRLKGTQTPMSHTSYMVSEHNMYKRRLRSDGSWSIFGGDKNKKEKCWCYRQGCSSEQIKNKCLPWCEKPGNKC
jgi:hypothetical protein